MSKAPLRPPARHGGAAASAGPAGEPDSGDEFSSARVRGWLMQQSLCALLDKVAGTRQALPHLAALELSLGKRGIHAIAQIPDHHLPRICQQLSNLPLPLQDAALHELLSLLLQALHASRRVPERPRDSNPRFLSTFASDSQVEITEASLSDFNAASRR
jgi:hypothetical protein